MNYEWHPFFAPMNALVHHMTTEGPELQSAKLIAWKMEIELTGDRIIYLSQRGVQVIQRWEGEHLEPGEYYFHTFNETVNPQASEALI